MIITIARQCGCLLYTSRHLLLPMNLKKCIEVINQCQIRDLDYGDVYKRQAAR